MYEERTDFLPFFLAKIREHQFNCCGEGEIRTLGPASGTTVFETAPFNHSGTSPAQFKSFDKQIYKFIPSLIFIQLIETSE